MIPATPGCIPGGNVLGGVGPVVHQEELDVVDVVDDKGLVARGHHELGLLVGAIADLRSGLLATPALQTFSLSDCDRRGRGAGSESNVPRASEGCS